MDNSKVLLIEDDLFLREIYQESFKDAQIQLTLATEGEEGLKKIKEGNWSVVLIDMNLPKMNGIDILKEVKAESTIYAKKYIFLTNSSEPYGPESDEAKLSDGILVKAEYNPQQLIDKILEYVEAE